MNTKRITQIWLLMSVAFFFSACSDNKGQDSTGANSFPEVRRSQLDAVIQVGTAAVSGLDSTSSTAIQKQPQAATEYQQAQVDADFGGMKLKVLDISERSHDGGNALAVTFSVPLDPSKKHDDYLQVSSENGLVKGSWVLSKSGKIAYFPNIEPKQAYKVQVYQGLQAGNREKLHSTESQSVTTRNIQPSFSFASQGSFLPMGLHSGLPVVTVNVPEVDVNFHRVKPDRLQQFLNQTRNNRYGNRYNMRYLEQETELVYSARYELDAPKNKRRELNLPVQNIDALEQPGVYMAVMQKPGRYYDNVQMTWFAVTDIGMHVRVYKDKYDVHLSSLKTAKPLKGVKVSWVNNEGAQVGSAESTPEGLATLQKPNNRGGYLLAEQGSSVSIVPLTNAALDLSDFDLGSRPQLAHELFIYGPRDLYRPGEIVQLSALLRNVDGRLGKAVPLQSKIKRPDGQVAKEFSWQPQDQSYYDYEFELPQGAQTGEWQLQVKNIDGGTTSYAFKVEEFLPERMKLSFNPGQAPEQQAQFFGAAQTVKVKVLGEYLYGAPAAGNRLEPAIRIRPKRDPIARLKDYQFGNIKEDQLKQSYSLDNINLNNSGLAEVAIESRWKQAKSPVEVTLLASLFESGGRPVTRRHKSIVWPKPAMIGIRPSFKDKSPEANSRVSFDIVRANAQGDKLNADSLEVQLIREDRRYFWEYSASQGWHYEYSDREYAEISRSISIKVGETATVDAAVEWGAYRLEVRDPEYGTLSSVRFHAGRDWYSNWRNNEQAGQASRPDKVSLALDKQHYLAGDIAVLSMVPPTAGEALVLVESDRPLFIQRIRLPKEGGKLEIPVGKGWNRHDLYISVVQLQAAQQSATSITPKRAFGLIHLPLNREARKLGVEIHSAEKIVPKQKYIAKVEIKNIKKHGKVKLTLAAVDVGVLSITDYKTPDPHEYFFEPRRYQIDSRDMYQKLIELNDNPLAKQRFGGDAELSRGGKKAQAEVQIVSLFSGVVDVNADGVAEVPLDIPDFNGRLRLMAVAFNDDSFGSAEKEMTVAAPLVTQLAMPRFLAMGDESTFAVDIHNLTDQAQELDVKLKADGPVKLKTKLQSLTLKAGEKTTLIYPVQTQYSAGRSQIHLDIQGMPGYSVSRNWGIQVRAAYPGLTQTKQAWLKPGERFELEQSAFSDMLPESIEAVVKLNNSIDLNMRKQMDALLKYPYGCLEQSTSSTYPWLFATEQNLQQMGLQNKTRKNRLESIAHGLQRIAEKQLSNGGYGLWTNKDSEAQWLTAYVGDFLIDARAQGVDIAKEQYDKTMRRLEDYVSKRNGSFGHPWNDYDGHYSFAYRAYAAYVLSRHNKASLSKLRSLLKHDAEHARSFLPLVHLGLALHNQGDSQLGDEVFDKAFILSRGDRYYADYGSDIRDTALAVHLLLRHKKRMDKARELGIELVDKVQQRSYLSTQERNSLFLAGLALETHFAKEWQADMALKGAIETLKYTGSFAQKYDYTDLQDGISIINSGAGDLLVDVDFQGHGTTPPNAQSSKNLSISRDYFNTKGKMIDPSELTVGDLILVRLQLGTAWRAPDVMVVDLLPAGLELENQNLNHAIKLDEIQFNQKPVAYWREQTKIVHQEYRDDRFVAAVDAGYHRSNYLFYLARAVTPGVYKVPAPFVEDMYRPEDRAVGETIDSITVKNP